MTATLASLLRERALGLRLAVPPSDDESLSTRVAWVHNSDLADPTPWLDPAQLLLTDGAQFLTGGTDSDDYVRRLSEAGILGLGFATGILHPEIPPQLADACRRHGLPLIEVPRMTPFIGIVRFVADQIAAERREQLEWSLRAHRALARAALQPDGLEAVLRELERQLDGWVVLCDASGARVATKTVRPVPDDALPVVLDAVRTVLARGTRAALRVVSADTEITVQTLGRPQGLRGALVVGTSSRLGPAGSDLVASVIALASIALDQTRRLDQARRRLRAGLLELLRSGESAVARRTAEQLWGPLPREPLNVVRLVDPPMDLVLATLEQYVTGRSSRVFFAERENALHLIMASNRVQAVLDLLHDSGVGAAGVSSPVGWDRLQRGLDEAQRAARFAAAPPRVVRFADLAGEGMLGLLETSGGTEVAGRVLEPLLGRPAPERDTLLSAVRVWLDHNCAWEPAAQVLRVHRHTLRNRIDQVGHLLDIDLTGFAGRAELWAAISLLNQAVGSAGGVVDHQRDVQ